MAPVLPAAPALLAASLLAAGLLAAALVVADLPAGAFAGLALVAFAAAGFAGFLAGALRAFFTGSRDLRSASSSDARSSVSVAGSSPLRRLAFVSPSVTYGPKRPSLTTMGAPLTGSGPSSLSGGAGARWPRRVLGWASSACACSSVTVNSWSSDSSERDSVPRFTYGPYRPFVATISLPSASAPSTRGKVSSRRASSSVTDSNAMSLNSDAVRPVDVPSSSSVVTYGPYRPALTTTRSPVAGSVPSSRSPAGAASSSSALATVSSSGGRSSGMLARSSPRWTYGP